MMNLAAILNQHQNIVIIRHKAPDLDAYGSQFGLYYALKEQYPTHNIQVVGDQNNLNFFEPLEPMLTNFTNKCVFVLDTVSKQMLESLAFEQADYIILIDHHQNAPDVKYHEYLHHPGASSTAEMIIDLLQENQIPIPKAAARALYFGLVGDTGRFQYSNTSSHTFECAAALLEQGVDVSEVNKVMYSEPLQMKLFKAQFLARMQWTKHFVGYQKNTKEDIETWGLDTQTVSRGMVNQMAGIQEIPIWANFTYDLKTDTIICELRSREIPIIAVAKKYGGGGHVLACGCSVSSFEEADQILADLDQLLEESHG